MIDHHHPPPWIRALFLFLSLSYLSFLSRSLSLYGRLLVLRFLDVNRVEELRRGGRGRRT